MNRKLSPRFSEKHSEKHSENRRLRDLDPRELRGVEGGVMATYDENGKMIADCTTRLATLPGGFELWVPHGTKILGELR